MNIQTHTTLQGVANVAEEPRTSTTDSNTDNLTDKPNPNYSFEMSNLQLVTEELCVASFKLKAY